jgi:hypothetical protein
MKQLVLVLAVVVVAGSSASAQQAFDKDRHHWAKYKVGTSITWKMSVASGEQKGEGSLKQELKEVGAASYKLVHVYDMAGQKSEEEETEEMPTRSGEETLKIAGKEYKCVIWSSKSKKGETEGATRFWLADGVKAPLKLEIKDGDETSTLTAVSLSEKLKAGGKEYDCVKLEGEMASGGQKGKGKLWLNPDIPSMTVRMDVSFQMEMGAMETSLEVSAVDIKK